VPAVCSHKANTAARCQRLSRSSQPHTVHTTDLNDRPSTTVRHIFNRPFFLNLFQVGPGNPKENLWG